MKNLTRIMSVTLAMVMLFCTTSVFSVSAEVVTKREYEGFVYTGFLSDEAIAAEDENFKKSDWPLTIVDYTGDKTEVTIPTEIDGYMVKEVTGLRGNDIIKTLHIPNNISIINSLPKLSALTKITVQADNTLYSVKNNLLLNKSGTEIKGIPGGLKAINIPNGVKVIGSLAFKGLGITSVKIPNSVTTIRHQAFANTTLTSIELGKNVTTLGTYAFANCIKLKSIKLNSKLKTLPQNVFEKSYKLTSFTSSKNLKTIGDFAFSGSRSLKKVVLNKSVKTIKVGAFRNCKKLTKLYIYNKKCKIGKIEVSKKATIYGKKNSTAQKYAKKNKIKFKTI